MNKVDKKKKITLGITLAFLVGISIGAGLLVSNPPIWFTEQLVKNATRTQKGYPEIDDGLHVMLIGTGSPISDPERVGPSNLVIAGDKHFIIDSGSGSTRNLLLSGISPGLVDAAFLTHYHSDHIADLGELMLQRWATEGNSEPLPIYGPIGVTEVVDGFNDAFAQDSIYRNEHHTEEEMPINGSGGIAHEYDIGNTTMASAVIYEEEGVKITMFNVDHYPVYPAVAYKFEYKGRSVVISGDSVYTESLVEYSTDVDLLICEALNADLIGLMNEASNETSSIDNAGVVLADIPDYHMTPEDAATIAQGADVDYLVYTHMIPPLPNSRIADNMFLGDARKIFDGKIDIGRDGFFISMPADSERITSTNLLQDVAQLSPVLIVVITLFALGLMFGVGWMLSKNKHLKSPTILTIVSVVMGLLILTRISTFLQTGFDFQPIFHAIVEAIILIWCVLILNQKRKDRQREGKATDIQQTILN